MCNFLILNSILENVKEKMENTLNFIKIKHFLWKSLKLGELKIRWVLEVLTPFKSPSKIPSLLKKKNVE